MVTHSLGHDRESRQPRPPFGAHRVVLPDRKRPGCTGGDRSAPSPLLGIRLLRSLSCATEQPIGDRPCERPDRGNPLQPVTPGRIGSPAVHEHRLPLPSQRNPDRVGRVAKGHEDTPNDAMIAICASLGTPVTSRPDASICAGTSPNSISSSAAKSGEASDRDS